MSVCGTKLCAEKEREHRERIAQLLAALKAVEWRGPHGYCPLCLADKDEGSGRHAPDCIVGKELSP